MTPTLTTAIRTRSRECWSLIWDADEQGAMLFNEAGEGTWYSVQELDEMAGEGKDEDQDS